MRALFQFVKRVKATGVNEQLWKENKQIDELKFKFKEKEDPATYARFVKTSKLMSLSSSLRQRRTPLLMLGLLKQAD